MKGERPIFFSCLLTYLVYHKMRAGNEIINLQGGQLIPVRYKDLNNNLLQQDTFLSDNQQMVFTRVYDRNHLQFLNCSIPHFILQIQTNVLPSPIAAMLKLCAIIPKDLTNVLVNLDMLEMEKSALVIIEYHDSFIEFDCIASSDLYLCVQLIS